MNVPEDSHRAAPSPSKANPGGKAGAGSSSLWARMTGPSPCCSYMLQQECCFQESRAGEAEIMTCFFFFFFN